MFPSFVCWWNACSLPRVQVPALDWFPSKDPVCWDGSTWGSKSQPCLWLPWGISGRSLPFSGPLGSYLQNKGIGLGVPRQLLSAMPLRFKGFWCGGEIWPHSQGRVRWDAEMNVSGDPIRIRARLVQRLNLDSWGRPLHNTKWFV